MADHRELVEHFFRHEYGRLVALLTRSLGVHRLDLVEDVVQSALMQALQVWGHRGIPDDPCGWLYRTARNLAIDSLRRQQTQARLLPSLTHSDADTTDLAADFHFDEEIGDEPLRLLFVCCHDSIPKESQVALALKTICGFSTAEIARALLTTEANVQKRLARARERLRGQDDLMRSQGPDQLRPGLEAVVAVLYLLFNEGYYAAHADTPIRRDLCDEARRLGTMLAHHPAGETPEVHALMALICFHAARLDARLSSETGILLLDQQDRGLWKWTEIREGMDWMARSAHGTRVSRYHIEAAIAWEHCRVPHFQQTDWNRILVLYKALDQIAPSPLNTLNRAVAEAHRDGPQAGLARLANVPARQIPTDYPHWYAVLGELHYRAGDHDSARHAWQAALKRTTGRLDRELLERHLLKCTSAGPSRENGQTLSQIITSKSD